MNLKDIKHAFTPFRLTDAVEDKEPMRKQVQADVQAFLEGGGEIKVVQCFVRGLDEGYPALRYGKEGE